MPYCWEEGGFASVWAHEVFLRVVLVLFANGLEFIYLLSQITLKCCGVRFYDVETLKWLGLFKFACESWRWTWQRLRVLTSTRLLYCCAWWKCLYPVLRLRHCDFWKVAQHSFIWLYAFISNVLIIHIQPGKFLIQLPIAINFFGKLFDQSPVILNSLFSENINVHQYI